MISVRNHQRRLNGSKLILLLLAVFSLSSCGVFNKTSNSSRKTTKKVRVKRNTPRKTTTPTTDVSDANKKDDGVKIIKLPPKTDNTPPKMDDPIVAIPSSREGSYDIMMLMPLDVNRATIDADDRFIMYYAGAKIAGQKLQELDANITINVADTKGGNIKDILNYNVSRETDVIIGPYDKKDLKYAISFAKRQEVPLVSPWQALSGDDSANPYYVQLSPSLPDYYKRMIKDVSDHYVPTDVTIINKRNNAKSEKIVAYSQKLAKYYYGVPSSKPFNELSVSEDDLNSEDPVITALHSLPPGKKAVFVLPQWAGRDYSFIYNTLRRIVLEKGDREVVVYGMFSILNNDNIEYDLYKALQMRIVVKQFVDQKEYDVLRFKRDFLSLYGILPTEDAYEGYDNLMYIGRALNAYGKDFQYHLTKENGYMLQAAYEVEPKLLNTEKSTTNDNVELFVNKHVDILEFKDGQFTRIKE